MFEMINNLFFGIVGINMFIIGIVMVIEVIVMLVKNERGITHIRSILHIVIGPLLVYYGIHLAGKYLFAL